MPLAELPVPRVVDVRVVSRSASRVVHGLGATLHALAPANQVTVHVPVPELAGGGSFEPSLWQRVSGSLAVKQQQQLVWTLGAAQPNERETIEAVFSCRGTDRAEGQHLEPIRSECMFDGQLGAWITDVRIHFFTVRERTGCESLCRYTGWLRCTQPHP